MTNEQIIRIMKKNYEADCADCKNDKEIVKKYIELCQKYPN